MIELDLDRKRSEQNEYIAGNRIIIEILEIAMAVSLFFENPFQGAAFAFAGILVIQKMFENMRLNQNDTL